MAERDLRQELLNVVNSLGPVASEIKQESQQSAFSKRQHSIGFYEKLLWPAKSCLDEINSIQIELIDSDLSASTVDQFDYIRNYVSSMPQCVKTPGRSLSVLVLDKTSRTFLGCLQFTTDLLKSEFKDAYLGLKPESRNRLKKHIRDHSVNVSICVPVQPFGFQYCGGKLLAMLCFSREIHDMYEAKFGYQIGMIVTTSINGKSVQYDRLRELKVT